MTFFVNLYSDGATFEESPATDTYQPVELPERSAKVAKALCDTESFLVSQLLADVYLAGVKAGERAARTGVSSRRAGPPAAPADRGDTPR